MWRTCILVGFASTLAAAADDLAPSPFHRAGVDFKFLFDAYVNGSFNSPYSGFNQLRNFDYRANTAHVNLAKITIDRTPDPVGFHLDVGFGETLSAIHASDRAPEALKYFEQAYISLKPGNCHGVEIDAGEFTSWAGAEVIETNGNWNYSRSLLFAWAVPYYHFGVRAAVPIGKFTGGVQVVQGWNNVYDNNSGKTVGINGAYAWKKVTWTNNYYVGPEKTRTNIGLRQLYDTTVLVNATEGFSYYVNLDYGRDKKIGRGAAQWSGIALAARYALGKNLAIAARTEYFDDRDGLATGAAQKVKEVTLTGEYKMSNWLMSRLELRDDWSNVPFFQKRGGQSRSQPTVLLGLIAAFGAK
ncbi:MAG: hypothetical protein JWP63_3592 [Candidatus Solibacter sp.]|nr:hypothetical protein [Candidatus Solibacter sp.]